MSNPYDPDMSHLRKSDFEQVYEPSEDTWLFVDALELEKDFITKTLQPTICFEIGVSKKITFFFLIPSNFF